MSYTGYKPAEFRSSKSTSPQHENKETRIVPATYIAVTPTGHRVGDSHPRVRYTDHEIELMRQLREAGLTCRAIAEKFECAVSLVHNVVTYKARSSQVRLVPYVYRRPTFTPARPDEFPICSGVAPGAADNRAHARPLDRPLSDCT